MTPEQRKARIYRAEKHARMDRLVAGNYITSDHKGCSVGCDCIDIRIADGYSGNGIDPDGGYHRIVADHDGTPEWLEHVRDAIFEGLPKEKRSWWHVTLAKALPATDNWQPYYHLICINFLELATQSSHQWGDSYKDDCIKAIKDVKTLHISAAGAAGVAESAAGVTESAAWAAALSAADVADSAARSAAWDVARSAADVARSAAGAAWGAAGAADVADSAARSAAWGAAWSAADVARSAAGAARSAAESAADVADSAARSAAGVAESAAYIEMAESVIKVFESGAKEDI